MIAKTEDGNPYSSAIINNLMGSFALFSSNPIIEEGQAESLKIDAVGWGDNKLPVKEVEVTMPGENSSMGRKWLNGKYVDSDNNLEDFQLQKPSPGEYSKQPPERIDNIEISGDKNMVILSWNSPYDPDSPSEEINYEIYSSIDNKNFELLENIDITKNGDSNTALIDHLYYEKDYYFTIKAIDVDENESEVSNEVHYKTSASDHIKPLPYGNYQKSNIFEIPVVTGEWSIESIETIIEENYSTTNFARMSLIGDGEVIYLPARYQGKNKIIAIKNNEIAWDYNCVDITNLILLGKDGTIYASDSNSIFALSPSGKLKWKEVFNEINTQFIAVDSQERIYFVQSDILYSLKEENNQAFYDVLYEFDNFEISAPIVVDSNDNIYFSNRDILYKAKYNVGKIGEKLIEPIYDDGYSGTRDVRPIIEEIKLTSDDKILLKIRDYYCNKENRKITMNSLLPSINEEIVWTGKSYGNIEAVIDDQFLTWDNHQYSLYGISIETGEILWSKKWLNYFFFYLMADYNRNIYLIRYSSLEGYNIDSITNDEPGNGLILEVPIGERTPFFSIGQSRIYFSCYDKFKSLTY